MTRVFQWQSNTLVTIIVGIPSGAFGAAVAAELGYTATPAFNLEARPSFRYLSEFPDPPQGFGFSYSG